ncbi:hypothetical protein ASF47_17300 [Nocardioides sp. Leaf285]|nr:hypothetical protein ASF47_17300 [Nocardioides sp. Leaf285]
MHKSLRQDELAATELPDFAVVTGTNGSGKTHLLEMLSSALFGDRRDEPLLRTTPVHFVGAGDLLHLTNPSAVHLSGQVTDGGHQLQRGLAALAEQLRQEPTIEGPEPLSLRKRVATAAVEDGIITYEAMSQLLARTLGDPWELPPTALASFAPLAGAQMNPFADNIGLIFRNWLQAHLLNDLQELRAARGQDSYVRSPEQMRVLIGPPPWEVFNLTLHEVGLPFEVTAPPDLLDPYSVNAELIRTAADGPTAAPASRLRMEDLSSGERTLLGLALVLLNITATGMTPRVPSMVVLDEPDATLHPSMVKNLVTMLQNVFCQRFGVRVVLTTHSPSTVALAPPESIILMSREGPRLRPVSTDTALAALTVGIPTLSVRSENRRQVFVEAPFDERAYTTMWALLGNRLNTPITPVFIASGGDATTEGRSGGNTAVKNFVRRLREAGSRTAVGIVDRDNSEGSPDGIFQLQGRYAIENLLLDPLLLGVRLVNIGAVTMDQLGVPINTTTHQLIREHCQQLVDHICTSLDMADGETRDVLYLGGQTARVPSMLLNLQGHDLNDRVLHRFGKLHRDRGASPYGHLTAIFHTTVREYPEAVPQALLELFASVTR